MDKLFAVLVVLGVAVFVSFLLSWPVMMLWNGCLVGAIAGVNEVTWLQAWGINLLFGIMVRSGVETKAK